MAKAGSKRGLVLVVDDEQLIVDFLRTGLEYQVFAVKTAGDGLSALSAARSLHPDLASWRPTPARDYGPKHARSRYDDGGAPAVGWLSPKYPPATPQ